MSQSLNLHKPEQEAQKHWNFAHILYHKTPKEDSENSHFLFLFGSPETGTAGEINVRVDTISKDVAYTIVQADDDAIDIITALS